MRIRLNLLQLNAFLKLAELGGFRDAAQALGVSQPALSRTIQLIESRLNARLFDRDTRKVTLTPAGEKLRPLAQQLVQNYTTAFEEFDDFVLGRRGRIRIASLPSISSALLPQTIADFQSRYPGVRIDIWEDVTMPVHRAVSEGDADIGLATAPQVRTDLNYKALVKDEIVLVCRTDDPLVRDAEYDWTVFKNRPFIAMSPESDLRGMIDHAFVQAGLTVEALYNCKSPTTIGSLISANLGISALPRLTLAQLASPALTWRRLSNPHMSRSLGIATHAGRSLSPAALLFIKELKAHARLLFPSDGPPPSNVIPLVS